MDKLVTDIIKAQDYLSYLPCLFMSEEQRAPKLAFLAFSCEVDKILETATDPVISIIKLKWWYEAIEDIYTNGKVKSQPTLKAISENKSLIIKDSLLELLEAASGLINGEISYIDYIKVRERLKLGENTNIDEIAKIIYQREWPKVSSNKLLANKDNTTNSERINLNGRFSGSFARYYGHIYKKISRLSNKNFQVTPFIRLKILISLIIFHFTGKK